MRSTDGFSFLDRKKKHLNRWLYCKRMPLQNSLKSDKWLKGAPFLFAMNQFYSVCLKASSFSISLLVCSKNV